MRTKTNPASATIIFIALVLFVAVFVFFMYTFLHEAGHALAGLLFGQTLTDFNVSFWDFSAHVGMSGDLTASQRAAQSAAGAGLPLLAWALFISLVPRKAGFSIESLKLTASMAVINSLLAWVALPILYLLGMAPSDDVTNFLHYSQMQPWLLLGLALVLYAASWMVFLRKIDGLRNELRLFSQPDAAALTIGARSSIPVMSGLMLFCVILTLSANNLTAQNPLNRFSPPQDFQSVAQIDLASRAYTSETLQQFSVDKNTVVGVFIAVRGINTRYFDLSINGLDGFHEIILHGEGYRAEQDGGLWEKQLPPGQYRLVMTSEKNPGTVSIYMQGP